MPGPELADVEWIARTDEVGVRINTLAPGQGTPWHFHSAVTDDVFCLDDGLAVELRDPDEALSLRPGERVRIAPRRVHRVANRSAHPMRYLLVQATGPYDFNAVP
jgi:mannose-6-phosphate isomerase-like protein (cupin superfamily)